MLAASAALLGCASFWLASWAAHKCSQALDLPRGATCHRSCYVIAWMLGSPFRVLSCLPFELTLLVLGVFALILSALL